MAEEEKRKQFRRKVGIPTKASGKKKQPKMRNINLIRTRMLAESAGDADQMKMKINK